MLSVRLQTSGIRGTVRFIENEAIIASFTFSYAEPVERRKDAIRIYGPSNNMILTHVLFEDITFAEIDSYVSEGRDSILKAAKELLSEYDYMTLKDMFDYIREMRIEEEGGPDASDLMYGIIEAADRCRGEIVPCFIGAPGIGKTEVIERFARDHGRNVVHIIVSQILPTEVSGITMPNQETRSMDVFDHFRLSHMKDGDILFFDELLKGQQQVLNACLTLIQERRLMSGSMLPDVLIIAAANPLKSPSQLPLEIRQRFMFVQVDWNPDNWVNYMVSKGFDNTKALKALLPSITTSDNNDWNTLTPRTATKLCDWLRSTRDTGLKVSVERYIRDTFGIQVLEKIKAVAGENKETKAEKVKKTVDNLLDGVKYNRTLNNSLSPEKTDEIDELKKEVNTLHLSDPEDMRKLIDMLKDIPEWPAIMESLSDMKF